MDFELTLLGFSPRSYPVFVEVAAEAWGRVPQDLRVQVVFNQEQPAVTSFPEGWQVPKCVALTDWTPSGQDGVIMPGVMHEPAVSRVWHEVHSVTRLRWDELGIIVHPSASIAPSANLGPGTWVQAQSTVATLSNIGPCCHINRNASVGHHNEWGPFSRLNPGAHTAGFCKLGERVTIGIGAVLREGIELGDGVVVGGSSMVLKNVPAGQTVVGNPAKPLQRK